MARQLPLALRLRPGHTFDTLLAGDNEQLLGELYRLASQPACQLYLWGAPGSGRSHMLEATVDRALGLGRAACLLPGEALGSLPVDMLEGLESQDLVALDDLDALVGHGAWEEALFHLYNRCRQSGTTLVFAAAASPRSLGLKLADLASRLAAGPVFRVRPLDEPALIELLRQRAGALGLEVAEDVARFIVHRSERSPEALLHHLEKLDQEALVQKRRLTLPFVKQSLGW